jgi:hypothetical protein
MYELIDMTTSIKASLAYNCHGLAQFEERATMCNGSIGAKDEPSIIENAKKDSCP